MALLEYRMGVLLPLLYVSALLSESDFVASAKNDENALILML